MNELEERVRKRSVALQFRLIIFELQLELELMMLAKL